MVSMECASSAAHSSRLAVFRMIYSTINPLVHLLRTSEHEDEHQQLNFAVTDRNDRMHRYGHFGVSLRRRSCGKACAESLRRFGPCGGLPINPRLSQVLALGRSWCTTSKASGVCSTLTRMRMMVSHHDSKTFNGY